MKLEEEIFGNKLKNLYDSISNLSDKKNVEDKFQNIINEITQKNDKLQKTSQKMNREIRKALTERDKY